MQVLLCTKIKKIYLIRRPFMQGGSLFVDSGDWKYPAALGDPVGERITYIVINPHTSIFLISLVGIVVWIIASEGFLIFPA